MIRVILKLIFLSLFYPIPIIGLSQGQELLIEKVSDSLRLEIVSKMLDSGVVHNVQFKSQLFQRDSILVGDTIKEVFKVGNELFFDTTINQFKEKVSSTVAQELGSNSNRNLVQILYITDRIQSKNSSLDSYFGLSRDKNKVHLGKAEVRISPDFERGGSNFNSQSKIKISGVKEYEDENYYQLIKNLLTNSENKIITVYIHGFNTTFEEAAKDASKLYYNTGIEGLNIIFSWTSVKRLSKNGYITDDKNSDLAIPRLKNFLYQLTHYVDSRNINLVSHSMGTKLLTNSLHEMRLENKKIKFGQVILAAPDIDAEVFRERFAESLPLIAKRTTVYCSAGDRALYISSSWRSGAKRLGQSIQSVKGLEFIDASSISKDLLNSNHSYFLDKWQVFSDIANVLNGVSRRNRSNLIYLRSLRYPQFRYWAIRK